MPLNSINTNAGAMAAIATFNAISAEMAAVQMRITTGKKVTSVKDNPAIWAIAQNERGEVRGLDAVKDSLNRGQSAVGVAMSAAEEISELLIEMKSRAVAAAHYPLGDPARAQLNADYLGLKKQIDTVASSADFNGINLLAGGGATGQIKALANTSATMTIDVAHIDMSTGGALLSGLPPDLLGGLSATGVADIGTAMNGVNSAIGHLGTGSKA